MTSSTSNWILCVKIVLISSGVVSLVTAMRFTVNGLPTLWLALISLLKPPYLYVIINGIIITIFAVSCFTQSEPSLYNDQSLRLISAKTPPLVEISAATEVAEEQVMEEAEEVVVYEVDVMKPVLLNGLEVIGNEEEVENEDVDALWSTYTPPQEIIYQETETEADEDTKILLSVTEKPLELSLFSQRKPLKSSTEGAKAQRVARPEPETEETLESTWRMITEGRRQVQQPTRKKLKKAGTFKDHGLTMDMVVADENFFPQNPHVQKSETFNDRTNNCNDSLMNFEKIRKDPSLSRDELNIQVEAFIQKCKEEMRLQRQESLKQYMENIKLSANH